MGVVAFRSAEHAANDAVAAEIIDALGIGAELELRRLAACVADPRTREGLERLAEVIAKRQGFTWYLG